MYVYPVNAIEASIPVSAQLPMSSNMMDLYNRYLAYQVDFNEPIIEISGTWQNPIPINTIIVGNTNAKTGVIRLYSHNTLIYEKHFVVTDIITIVEFKDVWNNFITMDVTEYSIQLSGDEILAIGLLFLGEAWELPRFSIIPIEEIRLRGDSGRSFSGQATGIIAEPLRSFTAIFTRVPHEMKAKFDDYIHGVQNVLPHVINPYPEATDKVKPFFATVDSYSPAEKRHEDNFFWNFSCVWQEAK